MVKRSFADDYSEGAHPRILEALARTNTSQQSAYGNDDFCEEARRLIRQSIGADDASIFFVTGGTAANLISIACCLRPHEAVIAPTTGHISTKEAGAIEATGHKVILAPAVNGKLTPKAIQLAVGQNSMFAHQAKPRMVYISNATETGTIYTKKELEAVAAVCKSLNLILFMDGARLAAALTSRANDTGISLTDIYNLTDMFWIGGTKTGALLGEAVVIKDQALASEFPYHMKQHGQLLAKGRILGVQFTELFSNNLIFDLAKDANLQADRLSADFTEMGIKLQSETETNQVFPILPKTVVDVLQQEYEFHIWEHLDDGNVVIRLLTSWATEYKHVEALSARVRELI
ncbi:hypothetical protein LTR99_009571 [Exophiala xenobiotica]|uniref:Aromatic amino acid beta-eliminating lyase/threonine aldolase domain-containing protein n=1 Tax=Vermiconidia calcicola TaxID=1690605 RepID=A0AAV9Q186_9PEZI|nr:hypothetical protein LTR92_007851 [Exophiala xenobiotica]KAK5530328.1 hypothetical protein LTR23_010367 [Chaetothyriales sp. CCFEE 6169]KAK5533268.1 hypothetical protein LTR25_007133 [Vermiconidia calcicola]KAK5272041.1 hypothetical protein LTR96_001671 [Exophiala xenobiotica]KAK5294173.1 hypothetical protein LTR99_009571 [Exophiala xenobiotica]